MVSVSDSVSTSIPKQHCAIVENSPMVFFKKKKDGTCLRPSFSDRKRRSDMLWFMIVTSTNTIIVSLSEIIMMAMMENNCTKWKDRVGLRFRVRVRVVSRALS